MSQGVYGDGAAGLSAEVNGNDANVGIAVSVFLMFNIKHSTGFMYC